MRILFLLFISLFLFAGAQSQDIQFGGMAALNFSGAIVKYPPFPVSQGHPAPGFEIGGFADMSLSNRLFSFRPSLIFSLERASAEVEGDKAKIDATFIKLPLPFIYHSPFLENRIFFGLGPYIAYCLGGKYNWAETRVQTLSFGNNQNDFGRTYKRIDLGADMIAGYQYTKKISFSAKMDFGFINAVHTTEDPGDQNSAKIHTISFAITGGYLFGGK